MVRQPFHCCVAGNAKWCRVQIQQPEITRLYVAVDDLFTRKRQMVGCQQESVIGLREVQEESINVCIGQVEQAVPRNNEVGCS